MFILWFLAWSPQVPILLTVATNNECFIEKNNQFYQYNQSLNHTTKYRMLQPKYLDYR